MVAIVIIDGVFDIAVLVVVVVVAAAVIVIGIVIGIVIIGIVLVKIAIMSGESSAVVAVDRVITFQHVMHQPGSCILIGRYLCGWKGPGGAPAAGGRAKGSIKIKTQESLRGCECRDPAV